MILVTGGAGYIGSVVVEKLLDNGYDVVVIDDLRNGKERAVDERATAYYESIQLCAYEVLADHKIDTVIHLAAMADVPDSVAHPIEYYNNNINSTLELLVSMREHNVKNIIFSSTAAVYGEPQYSPIDENHSLYPCNPYGKSKLACEWLIKDYANAYPLNYYIFRYFCVAGATEQHGESRDHRESHAIPLIIDTAIKNRNEFHVFGNNYSTPDGTGVRDYIHVEDIADAHLLALEKIDKHSNFTINLGSSLGYSVKELIKTTEESLGLRVNYRISPPRKGDPSTLVATNSFAQGILGWTPKRSLQEIIQSAYQWRKNPLY